MPASILFFEVTGSSNTGDMAVIIAYIKGLRQCMPDADITIWGSGIEVDRFYEDYDVRVHNHPWYRRKRSNFSTLVSCIPRVSLDFLRRLLYDLAQKFNKAIKHPYDEYDVVIQTRPDTLNEPFHGFLECVGYLATTLLARLIIRKPIIIGPASIGPLTSRFTQQLARFVLNKVDIIALRDEASKDYLQALGINASKLYSTADMAFLLDPASPERVREILTATGINPDDRPLIGICPHSGLILGTPAQTEKYGQLLAQISDHLIEKLDAKVCLIPHGTLMPQDKRPFSGNDKLACSVVHQKMKNRDAANILSDDYTPEEIKGVIGECDMFIGCKFHSAVAATSQGVPTVALSYGEKFTGLMNRLGQEQCVISVHCVSISSELKSKADYVWENRDEIRLSLKKKASDCREQALAFCFSLKERAEVWLRSNKDSAG